MFKKEKIYYLAIIWLNLFVLGANPVFATDEFPDGFGWNQSPNQAFYFITNAVIDDYSLIENEDWIGAFYGEVCIGSRQWNGSSTDIPVMGYHEDYPNTFNYIIPGQIPRFVIYDASEDSYYESQIDYNLEEQDLTFEGGMVEFHIIDELHVEKDCNGNLGAPDGYPFLDDCNICSEGDTGHPFNSDIDCNGVCFGIAYEDDCATCDDDPSNDCLDLEINLNHVSEIISAKTDTNLVKVAVELVEGATPLPNFRHPENALYIFGPEDGSIEQEIVDQCDYVVYIPTVGCMNLAATVNVLLYDCLAKTEQMPLDDEVIKNSSTAIMIRIKTRIA